MEFDKKGVSEEMKAALEAVGFKETKRPGFFTHKFIYDQPPFDFTALSIDGAIQRVFINGVQVGREELRSEIISTLDS